MKKYDSARIGSHRTVTAIQMEINEASPQTYPMLEGWTVPGDYGWRVISVTPRTGGFVTRVK